MIKLFAKITIERELDKNNVRLSKEMLPKHFKDFRHSTKLDVVFAIKAFD